MPGSNCPRPMLIEGDMLNAHDGIVEISEVLIDVLIIPVQQRIPTARYTYGRLILWTMWLRFFPFMEGRPYRL